MRYGLCVRGGRARTESLPICWTRATFWQPLVLTVGVTPPDTGHIVAEVHDHNIAIAPRADVKEPLCNLHCIFCVVRSLCEGTLVNLDRFAAIERRVKSDIFAYAIRSKLPFSRTLYSSFCCVHDFHSINVLETLLYFSTILLLAQTKNKSYQLQITASDGYTDPDISYRLYLI